jgi:hypothetical protein
MMSLIDSSDPDKTSQTHASSHFRLSVHRTVTMPTIPYIYYSTLKHTLHYYTSSGDSLKMDQAFGYTTASTEKCKTLVEFVKARQQIEADYASALRTLLF